MSKNKPRSEEMKISTHILSAARAALITLKRHHLKDYATLIVGCMLLLTSSRIPTVMAQESYAPMRKTQAVDVQVALDSSQISTEVRVAASTDDAEESASGSMSLTSSDLELILESSDQTVGMRFNGIKIPHGSIVTNAYIQFQVDETGSVETSLTIQGEDTDHALTFSSNRGDITSRPKTSAVVLWNPNPWLTVHEAGPDQMTPDIASVIQEIVARPGWASGNSLAIIISGTGKRTAESYDGTPSGAPLLHVEYIPSRPVVMIHSPAVGSTFIEGNDIEFNGSASDLEDGDLSGMIHWSSDLDGALGTSASISRADLSVGIHTITATVEDSSGFSDEDTTTLTVYPMNNVLVGAGDIADCGSSGDEETAALLSDIPGTVFTLGDNVYPDGTEAEFNDCYDPSWGLHKGRTRPAIGNHDTHVLGAPGYFNYFGAAAGNPGEGYYSYDVGTWHIIVLNSECSEAGGCDLDSPQGQWLQADLVANPGTCTLAYWHAPLFSSDYLHGNNSSVKDFWTVLYQAGADVVLNGHAHDYERFGLQDPNGIPDPEHGIREFIAGTGGKSLFTFITPQPNSEVRYSDTFGVLKLTLNPGSYDWEFIPVAGGTFSDVGSASCVPILTPNNPPAAQNDSASTLEDTPVTVDVAANDSDPDGNLDPATANTTCSTCTEPSNGSLVNYGAGTFVYTPILNFNGSDSFVYEICDTGTLCDTATVTLTVNPANPVKNPPVADDQNVTTDEELPLDITLTGSDPDGDPLTFIVTSGPSNGTLSGSKPDLTYAPDADFNGLDSFTFVVHDGFGDSNTGKISITVNPVNDAPIAANDAYSTNEGIPLNIVAPGVLGNDSDVDNSVLTAVQTTGPSNGALTLNADGSFSYTPNANFSGTDTFTYRANDGSADSNVATVTITVNPFAPVTVDIRVETNSDDAEEHANGRVGLTSSDLELVQENDLQIVGIRFTGLAIPPGATITSAYLQFQVDEVNSEATNLSIQAQAADNPVAFVNTTGDISSRSRTNAATSWAPPPWLTRGEAGPDQQTPDIALVIQEVVDRPGWASGNALVIIITGTGKRVADSYDGDPAGAPLLHVEYTFGTPNDPPVGVDDSYTTDEDTALNLAAPGVLGNDSDPEGDSLAAMLDTGPSDGTLNLNSDGSFTYTPNPDFNGSDRFTYRASDGRGDSNVASVAITVNPVDDPPVASDDAYDTTEDTVLNVSAPGVLENDTDVDGDSLTAVLDTNPGNGTLSLNADGSFTYTPNAGFTGTDRFMYHANDGTNDSGFATVTITVGASAPMTFDVRVGFSSDDAEEGASGRIDLNSSDLELVLESDIQVVGMRFTDVRIPAGATITSATLQFQTDETNSEATDLTIQAQAADNAATFIDSTGDISTRPRTIAAVPWAPPPWLTRGEAGPDQQTPDIAMVIQEIVDRPGWASGDALVVIITGTGKRVADSYDGDPNGAPLLHVEYVGP